jgi:hypothetical protein
MSVSVTAKAIRRRLCWKGGALAAAVAVTACASEARAQSKDKDKPTRMVSNEVKGVGNGALTEYYYTFGAGPGDVVLTLDGKKKSGINIMRVKLFTADFKPLFDHEMYTAEPTSQRHVEKVSVPRAQPVILQVVTFDSTANWSVRIAGAATFADGNEAPPQRARDAAVPPPTPDNRLACIPKNGFLRIEMEDGSAQEVNLTRVRRVFLKP